MIRLLQMSLPSSVLAAVIAVAVLAGCGVRGSVSANSGAAGSAGAGKPRSGIRGRVLLHPACPVQRAGQSCVRPYETTIAVSSETSARPVAMVRARADGRFAVQLAAGRYLLVPQAGRPFPRASPQTVTVRPGRYTSVVVRYDSGIR